MKGIQQEDSLSMRNLNTTNKLFLFTIVVLNVDSYERMLKHWNLHKLE